jgi:hypothetical protein
MLDKGFITFTQERRCKNKESNVDNTIGARIIVNGCINSNQKRGM